MVMALSGFVLWFNNFVLRHFPKWITDAATAVHWYEALLATFAILIWHFYLAIFDPPCIPWIPPGSMEKSPQTTTSITGQRITVNWSGEAWWKRPMMCSNLEPR
jgi:hypothetical protein